MTRGRWSRDRGDEGVALVMALIFIAIVGLFATVALTKSETTSLTGENLRDRGKVQYALDAGIERALDQLSAEMADPAGIHTCGEAGDTGTLDTVTVNGKTVTVTCSALGGSSRTDTTSVSNKALVVRSTAADAFVTYGPSSAGSFPTATCSTTPSGYFRIGGPVYIAGPESNAALNNPVLVCNGDAVQSDAFCTDSSIALLTQLKVATSSFVRDCTAQTAVEASGSPPVLPARPAGDVDITNCHADFNSAGLLVGASSCAAPGSAPGVTCRVFYPGQYTGVPPLLGGSDGNYFASGTYWFRNIGLWSLSQDLVVGNTLDASDTGEDRSDTACGPVSAAAIAAAAPVPPSAPTALLATRIESGGGLLVLDGNSQIRLSGLLTIHSPPHPATAPATTLVYGGYEPWIPSGSSEPGGTGCTDFYALCNNVSSSSLDTNGRLWAPTAPFNLWASSPTDNLVPGGAVVSKLRLGASSSGFSANALSTSGGSARDVPPYRTVKLVSSTDGTEIKNIVVAEISNFNAFRARVFSWRTGLLTD
jgi:Tfp pilus assembly protein PilX